MVSTWFGLLFFVLIASLVAYSRKISGQLPRRLNADDIVLEKNVARQPGRGRIWIAMVNMAGVGCLLTWFGFIGLLEHFDATRPVKPDAVTGAVISQNNHGHIVYLTEREQGQLLSLQRISIGLALVATLATYFYKRATGKMPS